MGKLLSTTEAAERIGANEHTLKLMCRQGRIPCEMVARRYVIKEEDLPLIKDSLKPRGWPKGRSRKDNPK